MKLSNKLNQLVVTDSGKPSIHEIKHVYLKNNGTITGKLSNGKKVIAQRLPMQIWRYV